MEYGFFHIFKKSETQFWGGVYRDTTIYPCYRYLTLILTSIVLPYQSVNFPPSLSIVYKSYLNFVNSCLQTISDLFNLVLLQKTLFRSYILATANQMHQKLGGFPSLCCSKGIQDSMEFSSTESEFWEKYCTTKVLQPIGLCIIYEIMYKMKMAYRLRLINNYITKMYIQLFYISSTYHKSNQKLRYF